MRLARRDIGSEAESALQLHKSRFGGTALDFHEGEANWRTETPRSGATRIHVEPPVAPLDRGAVRVAKDDDLEARHFGYDVEIVEIVDDVHPHLVNLESRRLGESLCPSPPIGVSSDDRDWG